LRERLQTAASVFDFRPLFGSAKEKAADALAPFGEALERRAELWKGMQRRKGPEGDVFSTALVQAESDFRTRWFGIATSPEIETACDKTEEALRAAASVYVDECERAMRQSAEDIGQTLWFRTESLDQHVSAFSLRTSGKFDIFQSRAETILTTLINVVLKQVDTLFSDYESQLPLLPPSKPPIALSDDDTELIRVTASGLLSSPRECEFEHNWFIGKQRRRDAIGRVYAAIADWDGGRGGAMRVPLSSFVMDIVERLSPAVESELMRRQAAFDVHADTYTETQKAFAEKNSAFSKSMKAIQGM
jgi:hypothetical protein